MPNCQKCNHQWSWFDTVKIGFINNKKCPNCGERQYVSPQPQKKVFLLYFIPFILIVFLRPLFNLDDTVYFLLSASIILCLLIYIPFSIKLSNEQKPLW